ncbi:MAG: hypothetical protein L6R39_006627 [Caloplaca ligustica]|nr:MAG: hypothetical protein L6R39_006627 [Caloplaca ligustica]
MSNGSGQRATGSSLDSSIDALWGAVRPFAVSLRDVIMLHSPPSIPSIDGTSAASPVIIPSVQNRRAACTHLTMERLYGDYECMVCHRPSVWGWLYSCTQDDSDDDANPLQNRVILPPVTTADLAPWIRGLIAKGHYTEEQIGKMVAQRQKVLDTISASDAHFKKTQAATRRMSTRKSRALSTSIEANGHLPFPVITEVARSSTNPARQSLEQSTEAKSRIFPLCRYRACQLCRPTYRDRTWQVLEDAVTAKVLPSDIYENDSNRPVSDPDIVRSLGIRKAKAKRPPLRTFDSTGIYTINAEGKLTLKNSTAHRSASLNGSSADLADQKTEADTKGFRDSVKRAFKGMLKSRNRDSWSSRYSKRSARKKELREGESEEFDLALWKEMSEELLREAAGIPLPGHDGKDGLENEDDEVEVEDGVAVTEEAVDLGAADIIMSV